MKKIGFLFLTAMLFISVAILFSSCEKENPFKDPINNQISVVDSTPLYLKKAAANQTLKGVIIGIDPGHYTTKKATTCGYDLGSYPVSDDICSNNEAVFVYKIYLLLKSKLENSGAIVKMSDRANYYAEPFSDATSRMKPISYAKPDIVLALHLNSFADDYNKTNIYYRTNASGDKTYADILYTKLSTLLSGDPSLKYKTNSYSYVTAYNWNVIYTIKKEIPALYAEIMNLKNASGFKYIKSSNNQEKIAQTLYEAIVDIFKKYPQKLEFKSIDIQDNAQIRRDQLFKVNVSLNNLQPNDFNGKIAVSLHDLNNKIYDLQIRTETISKKTTGTLAFSGDISKLSAGKYTLYVKYLNGSNWTPIKNLTVTLLLKNSIPSIGTFAANSGNVNCNSGTDLGGTVKMKVTNLTNNNATFYFQKNEGTKFKTSGTFYIKEKDGNGTIVGSVSYLANSTSGSLTVPVKFTVGTYYGMIKSSDGSRFQCGKISFN